MRISNVAPNIQDHSAGDGPAMVLDGRGRGPVGRRHLAGPVFAAMA